MILKEKDASPSGDGHGGDDRAFYGHKQEQDVAFQLRREFGEHKQIHVINDLRLEHRGERAQIDHLILHPYGFIIVESKSIVARSRSMPPASGRAATRATGLGYLPPFARPNFRRWCCVVY